MAFKKIGTLFPNGAPVLKKQIITNSVVSVVNDSVKLASGFIALGTTGALVFGHIVAHETSNGVGEVTSGAAGASIGSYIQTFTAPSTNQTVAKHVVAVDISKHSLYSAEESQAIGTTTGSNLAGYTQDLSDENTLAETSAATTTGQYMGWGVDPSDSTKAIVNIYESQVFGV